MGYTAHIWRGWIIWAESGGDGSLLVEYRGAKEGQRMRWGIRRMAFCLTEIDGIWRGREECKRWLRESRGDGWGKRVDR